MVSTRRKAYSPVEFGVRSSRKTLAVEAAEVGESFHDVNGTLELVAEGELKPGSLPPVDQSALRTPSSPPVWRAGLEEHIDYFLGHDEDVKSESASYGGDSEIKSDNESDYSGVLTPNLDNAVDWDDAEGAFIVPRVTARKQVYDWNRPMKIEHKFFPSWFDLSQSEDQLGPLPNEWDSTANSKVSTMAVIVELPEHTEKVNISGSSERSKAFADFLRNMKAERPTDSSSKRSGKGRGGKKPASKSKKKPTSFERPSSQLPDGGWFRRTTSKSGSPP
ncbi:hypothetical protein R3P38DRAFT_2719819, partial [Favolaschia claudopus]